MADHFLIRNMAERELPIALDWAAAEGWNPGLHDATSFWQADPTGFLIGLLDDEPVAVISAVKYGATFAFIGLYIVKPEYRGRGFGKQIWEAALESLRGRTIGLDGVVEQQANYQRSGFQLAYRNVRYAGTGSEVIGKNTPPAVASLPQNAAADPDIVPFARIPFAELCAYDRPLFPDKRTPFLQSWITQPQGIALGMRNGNELAGYGVIRVCRSGYKIGPLFADSLELAERLFLELRAHVPLGAPFFIDAPLCNIAAVEMLERHGLQIVFETARMYLGAEPDTSLNRVFGITTFELG